MKKVYLDFNASTPIALEVAEAMRPYLVEASHRTWTLGGAGKESGANRE